MAIARHRLQSTLAILEQRDGVLNLGSLNAFTAAQKLGGEIHGFIAGSNVAAAAQEAAKVEGIDQIIKVQSSAYEKVMVLSLLPVASCIDRQVGPPRNLRSFTGREY